MLKVALITTQIIDQFARVIDAVAATTNGNHYIQFVILKKTLLVVS
jgi:hypothetical protein